MPTASPARPYGLTFWERYSLDGGGTYKDDDFADAIETAEGREYGRHARRVRRYRLFWAFYTNTVYQDCHRWAESLKDTRDLYGFIRNLQSPAYLLGEFWTSHLMGGPLDPEAGDGKETPSALPIVTENESLRPLIAQIWRDSNWQANKQVFTGFGSILGDAFLVMVDDPVRQKVYFKPIHPGTVVDHHPDDFGNVKQYELRDMVPDPRRGDDGTPRWGEVTRRVLCWRDEDDAKAVHYETFLGEGNDPQTWEPHDWRDYPPGTMDSQKLGPKWDEFYGFVPMVVVNHRDKGRGWGYSELFPGLSRFYEVDNLASLLSDQIAKVIRAPFLLAGATEKDVLSWRDSTLDRSTHPYVWTENPDARPTPMIGDLDIPGTLAYIASIHADLEKMYTELRADEAGADASGVSRRVARERVEARVIQERAPYDDALVRMHQMCFTAGAMQKYPLYKGLPADGYEKGLWEHSIGPRPVFTITVAERLEEARMRGEALNGLIAAGMPFRRALIEVGYTESQADEMVSEKEADDAAQMERQREMQAQGFDAEGNYIGEDGADEDEDEQDGGKPPARVGGKGAAAGVAK